MIKKIFETLRIRAKSALLFILLSTLLALTTGCAAPWRTYKGEIDIKETFYPYLTKSEQSTIWPEFWKHSEISVFYTRNEPTSEFRFFNCLVGVACIPYPHFVKVNRESVKKKIVKPGFIATAPDGTSKLTFTAPDYSFEKFEPDFLKITVPSKYLLSHPKIKAWQESAADRISISPDRELISFSMPVSNQAIPHFRGVQYPAETPNLETGRVVAVLKGHLKNSTTTYYSELGHFPESHLSDIDINRLRDGDVPISFKAWAIQPNLLPDVLEDNPGMTVAFPKEAIRWHNPSKFGPRRATVQLIENGPLTHLIISGSEASTESGNPVSALMREEWTLFHGDLFHYRGLVTLSDGSPNTYWAASWLEQRRVKSDAFLSSSGQNKPLECVSKTCIKTLSEATSHLEKTDAELEAEVQLYLKIAKEALLATATSGDIPKQADPSSDT